MNEQTVHTEIPYEKSVKHYDTSKMPKHQLWFFTLLIYILSKILMTGRKYKIEKINMDGIKPPYILLSNHMYFVDFYLNSIATFPHKVYNIASVDGYYRRPFLMELIGCMCKRKFTTDPSLIRSVEDVLRKKKGIMCMYPEARYTPVGTTAVLPDSLGMLVKKMKAPVVIMLHHGNHLYTPFWNFRNPRKNVPHHTTVKCILTPSDIEKMSMYEIQDLITSEMQYNEYKWQKENGIEISDAHRAEGLHKILYQCPHCNTEHKMKSQGTLLSCDFCGKSWELKTNGELEAVCGQTEFSHIPDWYEWERKNVRKEIDEGNYSFSDNVEVYSLPTCMRFKKVGKAKLTHSYDGFTVEGEYRGKKYRINRPVSGMYSAHVEYDYCYIRPEDCIDISTHNDSLYCYPEKNDVITKLCLATEELYRRENESRALRRRAAAAKKATAHESSST
ncbi:MAG: 1-acyl-sn-glycerol-3-phosphate acyltransferase [Clostridia bacterium]|nr:1-acyl-sn-glycerol-3-phosphate acyltransferase [Clostridia bacterium]